MSVLVPECGVLPQELRKLLSEVGPYFSVRDLPLSEFLSLEFISRFVKEGECRTLDLPSQLWCAWAQ